VGLSALGTILVGIWAGLALVIVVSYRPGGPWDLAVAAAAFLPVPIAAVSAIWPPLVRSWRASIAIAWLGLAAILLAAPLLLLVVRAVAAGGHQTLLPSAEVAYAGTLALASLCLFAAVGIVVGRRGRDVTTGPGLLHAVGLAAVLTSVSAFMFGGAAVANELALRDSAVAVSRFGPTDPALEADDCDQPVRLGPGANLRIEASASVDQRPIGSAQLLGVRDGLDERWQGWLDSRYGDRTSSYVRLGDEAWIDLGGDWIPTAPDPFDLKGRDQRTVDGPVVAALMGTLPRPVAEDLGTELVGGAKARHCRTAVDGPTALTVFLPLRWLAGGDMVSVTRTLDEWRGTLDWWVFTDGQLGQASVTISGYPGEAWPTGGIQGSMHATITALDRAMAHTVTPPTGLGTT
jgi:hypothetical protein